jgi:hypothetical protein
VFKDDNLTTFMCRLSRNSGSLNLLEPSGPVQACNGVALFLLYNLNRSGRVVDIGLYGKIMWLYIYNSKCADCHCRYFKFV